MGLWNERCLIRRFFYGGRMISVYNRKTDIEINMRRLETIEKYNKLIQWGRRHPTRFIEKVFQIQLIDYQKWIIMNTWVSEKAVWVCSRNAGKSFLLAIYIMTRAVLFPNYATYIMSNTGGQAQDTFMKIENIVKHNIASLIDTSDVFFGELLKSNANSDGFIHGSSQYECELYNGSTITSLVGKAANIVGKRSQLNIYDEAGKIEEEFFDLTEPFTAQNMDFKSGGNFDVRTYPKTVPTQCIYASSAEGVETHLFTMYKTCAMNMMMGMPGFFVADINCDLPLKPYLNGFETQPLLKQSEVDTALRANEQKALREYYNIFDTTGGANAAVSRASIARNTYKFLPVFRSEAPLKKYVICWDPASQADNSTVLICEEYKDKEKGWKLKVVNSINLIEIISSTQKRPLRTPEQVDWVRKIILAYNGDAPEYQNVEVYLDGGAGGGGRQYADLLMTDWTDSAGVLHRGITDKDDEVSQEQRLKFPHAVECLHIMNPTKYKTLMYDALGEMTSQDLIDFPDTDLRDDTKELEDGRVVTLTTEEIRALVEIDLTKEEMMAMQKYKNKLGTISFALPPNKEKKMHDDRAYCSAMVGWHLSEKRRIEMISGAQRPQADYTEFTNKLKAQRAAFNPAGNRPNPWAGKSNPFAR